MKGNLVGKFVSIWTRPTRRHKWKVEYTFVLVCHHKRNDKGKWYRNQPVIEIGWQTSSSGGPTGTSWSLAYLSDLRKVGPPLFDVKARLDKPKKKRIPYHEYTGGFKP